MPDSPITPAADMDLQRLQRKRKQVLTLGVAVWLLLLLFSRVALAHRARRTSIAAIEMRRLGADPGLHPRAHLVHALHRRPQEARAGHRRPLLAWCATRSMSSRSFGAAGIGAQTGSVLVALLFAAGSLAVFQVVARREEAFLAATFPADFAAYAARVPRFWPRLSQWREADELRVKPRLVRRTFLDACLFLLAVPAAAST